MPELISALPIWLQALFGIAFAVAIAFWKTRPKPIESAAPDASAVADVLLVLQTLGNELAELRREVGEIRTGQKEQGGLLTTIEDTNRACATEAQLIAKDQQNLASMLTEAIRDLKTGINALR